MWLLGKISRLDNLHLISNSKATWLTKKTFAYAFFHSVKFLGQFLQRGKVKSAWKDGKWFCQAIFKGQEQPILTDKGLRKELAWTATQKGKRRQIVSWYILKWPSYLVDLSYAIVSYFEVIGILSCGRFIDNWNQESVLLGEESSPH